MGLQARDGAAMRVWAGTTDEWRCRKSEGQVYDVVVLDGIVLMDRGRYQGLVTWAERRGRLQSEVPIVTGAGMQGSI